MKSQTLTLFVNPVPRISAQGRDKQTFTIIDPKTGDAIPTQSMHKTKEFGVGSEYSFQINFDTNRLQTGLDAAVLNPFYKLEVSEVMEKHGLAHFWADPLSKIVHQQEITKQTLFEIYDNVAPNYYTSDLAGGATIFNMGKFNKNNLPQPNFLQTFKIILYDGPNRFSDETARGRIAIQLIQNHNRIAKNKNTVNPALHNFYISEVNEEAQEISRKQDIIIDAMYELGNLQKNSTNYKNYQVACLLTGSNNKPIIKGNATPEAVKNALAIYLNDTHHQMENIAKFTKVVTMLKEKETKLRFEMMYLVQQAVNTGVMDIRDGYYTWHSHVNEKNVYKFSNLDKLLSLLTSEYKNYNPDDSSTTNWYGDLYQEVKAKNVWFE